MSQFWDCEGSISLTRRTFLKAGAVLSFASLPDFSFAQDKAPAYLLVVLLRGGMDGLYAVPPVGDKQLNKIRKHLNPEEHIKLDGFFALHPDLKTIADMYAKGHALIVHGTSIPYVGRSHFEGQDIMETGAPAAFTSKSGWLGRALDLTGGQGSFAVNLPAPLILRGLTAVDTKYPSWLPTVSESVYRKLLPLWSGDPLLDAVGKDMTDSIDDLTQTYKLDPGQVPFIKDLAMQAALRFSMPGGPQVAVLDHLGFDSHASEPGSHSKLLREFDDALALFRQIMGKKWADTLVVTVTEFGRTAAENGTLGTDHGYGTAAFVLGGKLKKSGIVADWPGLKDKQLYEERDLLATLDARALYGKIVTAAMGIDPELVRRSVLEHEPTDIYDAYLG